MRLVRWREVLSEGSGVVDEECLTLLASSEIRDGLVVLSPVDPSTASKSASSGVAVDDDPLSECVSIIVSVTYSGGTTPASSQARRCASRRSSRRCA